MEQGKKENEGKLVKNSRTILHPLAAVPNEKITLTKLKDGYRLVARDKKSVKDEKGLVESSVCYETEEHYGVPVKEISGEFCKEKGGQYEVRIFFEEKE